MLWELIGIRVQKPRKSPEDRFWRKVDKTDTCWLWNGALVNGYGYFWNGERYIYAHSFLVGPSPDGLCWDHLCRVRNCVYPEHLELVTQKENVRRGLKGVLRNTK